MILYRTIGIRELKMLMFARNPIYGTLKYQNLPECGCKRNYPYGIVCFFQEPIPFIDSNHNIEIVVDIKNPMLGKGNYNVPKDFYQNPRFNFRGKMEIKIPEAYKRKYTLKEVKAINLKNEYAMWLTGKVEEVCKEMGIELHNTKAYHFNLKPND